MSERNGLYDAFGFWWVYDLAQGIVRSHRSRLRFFERFVRAESGMRVLDFGCGTCDALKYLPQVEYVGVDPNPHYLARARRRLRGQAEVRCGGVRLLSGFPAAEFDVVLALGVLHHVENEDARHAVAEFARLLRPGGRLITHDPVITDAQGRMARWFVEHDRGLHVRTQDSLKGLLTMAFADVVIEIVDRPLRIPFTEFAAVCSSPHGS